MFLEIELDKVKVNEQGHTLKEVKALRSSDKTRDKRFFKDAITYVYYTYNKNSIFKNLLPDQRAKKVCEVFLPKRKPTDFESNVRVKDVIVLYNELSKSFKETIREKILSDIQDMMEKVANVPLTKVQRVKRTVNVEFFCDQCSAKHTQDVTIDTRLTIDNTAEKYQALDMVEKLLARESDVMKKIKEEEVDKKKNIEIKRMFDN